jgi:Bardet-Biedl syndrome 5 protein
MAGTVRAASAELEKKMRPKFAKLHDDAIVVWQNREIRFDIAFEHLGMRRGEYIVDEISRVEDIKGNAGDSGYLVISNLRLVWIADRTAKINLSIGFDCISKVETRPANSQFKGNSIALYLKTRFRDTSYEFIFTSVEVDSTRIFSSFQTTLRSFDSTKLYRDYKIRGAIIRERELIFLPQERVASKYLGVSYMTSEQGSVGTMYVTNIRVVWYCNTAESFNVSVPYIQVKAIKKSVVSNGEVCFETSALTGNCVLTFRSETKLPEMFSELNRLLRIYLENPILGVEVMRSPVQPSVEEATVKREFEDIEFQDPEISTKSNAYVAYLLSEERADRQVTYSQELGLAIESLPESISIEQLWKLI